jgi:exopolyphosphatase/guanosine-5'-triphosphate,3'-diphosphate pyrophosphatase
MIAIDLGSNTIRFLATNCKGAVLFEEQFVVRTAEGLYATGQIAPAAIARITEAIHQAQSRFDFRAHPIVAVATEALRQAKNRDAVLKALYRQTQIIFEIITPDMEARLTALATEEAAKASGLTGSDRLILDIGGASSESIWVRNQAVQEAISLPVGIVTATDRALSEADLIHWLEKEALAPLQPFLDRLPQNPNRQLCATAGTPTTLAAIKHGLDFHNYDKAKINGTRLTLDEMESNYQTLKALPSEKLEALVGRRRGDVVLTGTRMLMAFVRRLGFDACLAFDEGLREGVLTAGCTGTLTSHRSVT